MSKKQRTSWKRHRWLMNRDTLRRSCVRCGLVQIYTGVRGEAGVVALDSWTWAGSRIDYALPHPKACIPVPTGMKRVG